MSTKCSISFLILLETLEMLGPHEWKTTIKTKQPTGQNRRQTPTTCNNTIVTFVEISNGRPSHTNRHRSRNGIDHGVQTNLLPCVLLGDHWNHAIYTQFSSVAVVVVVFVIVVVVLVVAWKDTAHRFPIAKTMLLLLLMSCKQKVESNQYVAKRLLHQSLRD